MSATPSPKRFFDASKPERALRARADLREGFAQWRLAAALAWGDIKHRYRGSVLGPFWVTLTTAAMVVALGFFYSHIMRVDPGTFFPWLAISLILWGMVSQSVTDGAECFASAEAVIRQIPLPFTVHVLRCVLRNLLVAMHNLPLIIAVMVIFDVSPGFGLLAIVPGLLLFLCNAFSVAFFLGMVCARFRDIPPIISSLMQLCFFVTPIIWLPELLGDRAGWLLLNPFNSIMETMRAPLLGRPLDPQVWLSALGFTAALLGLALAFFTRFRGRIAFWV
ncbi:MAG: ABC transporter permease [Alphaproteobacteria bacterium]